MKKYPVLLIALSVLFLPACSSAEEPVKEEVVEESPQVETTEAKVTITTNSSTRDNSFTETPLSSSELSYLAKIETVHIASLAVKLAKGDTFSANMEFSGDFIFTIYDPGRRMYHDAGRIEGEYGFVFTAEDSGYYLLNFDDDHGHRTIYMEHNYPGTFYDASIHPINIY